MAKKAVKISVIGTGIIGSTVAYTLMLKSLADEIVLVNRNEARGRAKASDLSHCTPVLGNMCVKHGSFAETSGSDIVVVTAGVLPNEHGTRMDVLRSNIGIYKEIIPELAKYSPEVVIIVVTNPVDIMAYTAYRLSGFPPSRVIGSGTLLDTTRFRYFLGSSFDMEPSNIDATIIGEHGDSMVPLWSLTRFGHCEPETKERIEELTRRAGWEIRLGNEHSCYGISLSVVSIIEGLLERNAAVLPVSVLLEGEYGLKGVYMSLPVRLGQTGIQKAALPKLSGEELSRLRRSAELLEGYIREADALLDGGEGNA